MGSRLKNFGVLSLWIALAVIVAFIVFAPKNNHIEGKEKVSVASKVSATQGKDTVDYALPLHTKRSALVCPLAVVFDRREGYGLKGAVDAHLSVFGHDEAIAKSGCQEWREGLPISLTDDGKKQASRWDARNMCGMVDFAEGMIFSCDLRNAPGVQASPSRPQVVAAPKKEAVAMELVPPTEVALLIGKEESLNDKCRGGSGDDPATARACDEREAILAEIKAKNWCWGNDGQVGADRVWERCKK